MPERNHTNAVQLKYKYVRSHDLAIIHFIDNFLERHFTESGDN